MRLNEATILVVDDEPILREIMTAWFRSQGAKTFSAAHGAEALKVVQANSVDVIVSDMRMPVMDGVAFLKHLKAAGKYTPSVIFLSGFTDHEPRELYDLGAEALLEKPVERNELLKAVQRVLTDRRELWRSPLTLPDADVLQAEFASLPGALREGRIAFGRGGVCMQSSQIVREGPVALAVSFKADQLALTGVGMVRWAAPAEGELGVEILNLDDESRPWVLALADQSTSFIPRGTGALGHVAAESA